MNQIDSSTRGERDVNNANDVHWIADEMNKLKGELYRVWMKKHKCKIFYSS
jgi:hypothetical protein